jgi:hypothetical protein
MKFHKDGTSNPSAIFVFGSNLGGVHGGGAARAAYMHFDAEMGVGYGPTGISYAIPTMGGDFYRLMLEEIKMHVSTFLEYATTHPERNFFVTRIGCGIAGYDDADIAPMFRSAPDNCSFAEEWRPYLESS